MCGSGGTGRRARLRILWLKGRGGSSPLSRTRPSGNPTDRGVPLQRIMQMTGHKSLPTHMGNTVADGKDLEFIREKYEGAKAGRKGG